MSEQLRQRLKRVRRLVVKVGTRVLVDGAGRPDVRQMRALVDQVASVHGSGREVVLVTSGAIGSGMEALRWTKRPKELAKLQLAAAVGQSRLMSTYAKLFARRRLQIGQVLLTYDDLRHRVRHLNARNTFQALLSYGVVPVVNENDVTAVDEIKVGDNDVLAALVTALTDAELLVLLSSTDGLRAPGVRGHGGKGDYGDRVPYLPSVTKRELSFALGKAGELSVGGMESKLRAAQTAARSGALVVIADGRSPKILERVLAGSDVGTLIGGTGATDVGTGRKRWLAFFQRPRGAIVIDDGARLALEVRGRSLLPTGVREVQGSFPRGAAVNVKTGDGSLVARGIVEYSSADLARIRGKKTAEIADILGAAGSDEAIHRDNLVLLRSDEGEIV